ncbi:MAG: hypothetical protein M3Z03_09055 [Actinomycetota bacterium]|nr:hypothetical protein [Actinomycetota bacterium]
MPVPSPRVAGLDQRTTSLDGDEVPWIAVKAQRNADGTESRVWEKWVAVSTDPLYLALFARWDPGMLVRRHGHLSPHTLVVLDGELRCDGIPHGPGTHLELPLGASFGPFEAGPDGVHLYEVMLGDPRSWSDEPEPYAELCAARGVTPLPDPPIELPAGLEDLRAVFSTPLEEPG